MLTVKEVEALHSACRLLAIARETLLARAALAQKAEQRAHAMKRADEYEESRLAVHALLLRLAS